MREREAFRIKGKTLGFGDLHFSSSYVGTHVNYLEECISNMRNILSIVEKENPDNIVFFGDIIGVKERVIQNRQFLSCVVSFFKELYNKANGNVYSVMGNHDFGDYTDWDFLLDTGYIKNPLYLDYMYKNKIVSRIHFVNYGDESVKLSVNKNSHNIVFGHADYYVEGQSSYMRTANSLDVKHLKAFRGIEYIFSGHIHTPSVKPLSAVLPDGTGTGVFYLGSPSRVTERIESCWYLSITVDEEDLDLSFEPKIISLSPVSEVFTEESTKKRENSSNEEPETEMEHKSKVLSEMIDDILSTTRAIGNLDKQLDLLPATDSVRELARKYIHLAQDTTN